MKIELVAPLGDGAFADVWRARDELNRNVAVKIVREANTGVADALVHARALARAAHPNVVSVLTLEKVVDPSTGKEVDGVVMELIDGETLAKHMEGKKLTIAQLRQIGSDIVEGLDHIHRQGMTHGDLHVENIMVSSGKAKIIDILYLNTLSVLSTERREVKLSRDLISLRLILQELIVKSELTPSDATAFNNALESNADIESIKLAFVSLTSAQGAERDRRAIEHIYGKFIDADFIETKEYAEALDEETPESIIKTLIYRIAEENAFDYKREYYFRRLWRRLDEDEKSNFLVYLSQILDKEIPKGKWWPALRIVQILGPRAWNGLTKLVRIRLEGLITKDVLAGYKDVYGSTIKSGGSLGTYAINFWHHFSDVDALAKNIISMLRQSWYTQNYIADHFMPQIPKIAEKSRMKQDFILAFKVAVNNDAKIIISKLNELPEDWVEEILSEK